MNTKREEEIQEFINFKTTFESGFERFWDLASKQERIILVEDAYINEKLKPYFIYCYWDTGANYSFCTEEELITTIIDMESRGSDDSFDMEIVSCPDGQPVSYNIDIDCEINLIRA